MFSLGFSQKLWDLEDWNLVHTWTVGRCIVYTRIRLLLPICPFISSFFFLSNFQTFFSSHFSKELWGLEDWNLVHTWTVDRCIVYIWIRLLLLICQFSSSFFFLFNFQILNIFVAFFSGTVSTPGKRSTCMPSVYYRKSTWLVTVYHLTCVNKHLAERSICLMWIYFFISLIVENRGMSYAVAMNIDNTGTHFTRNSRGFLQILFLP